MIYLNNAATTWPKPPAVSEALMAALAAPPEGQGRGGLNAADTLSSCRTALGRLLGIADSENIFFASGATDALNRLLYGLLSSGGSGGGACVAVTQTEHNSVLRPVYNNPQLVSDITVVPCDSRGAVTPEAVEHTLRQAASPCQLLILNHCSNVTGVVQDAKTIGEIARCHGCLFVLDVSQSGGCVPVDADDWHVDALAFTGHKALFGPQGTGGYYVRDLSAFRPLLYGGTGRDSSLVSYDAGSYEYEPGTQNVAGIAALKAGVDYVTQRGVSNIMTSEQTLTDLIVTDLSQYSEVTLYGRSPGDGGLRSGVLSFNVRGLSPSDVAYILYNTHGIVLRSGLHCSPLIHKALGTEGRGTVRLSVSDMTTDDDINTFLGAMHELIRGLR